MVTLTEGIKLTYYFVINIFHMLQFYTNQITSHDTHNSLEFKIQVSKFGALEIN